MADTEQMICTESFMWNMGEFVHAGQIYYGGSPLVRKFPMFFKPATFGDDGRMLVEQATAGPGEQRNALRKPVEVESERVVAEEVPTADINVGEVGRSGRPWVTASKAEWLAYAQSLGIDGADMTKFQLVDAVEAAEGGN